MKQLIQNLLRPFGFEIHDMRKFGRDPWRDLQILLPQGKPVCFDVGAHRGETVRQLLAKFPAASVYAFEPDPDNFAELQRAAAGFPNVKLFALGMGDAPCTARLQKTSFSMSNSILSASASLHSEAHRKIGEVEINVTTVDQFCLDQNIPVIDLLKTDCQGFDFRVLQGARRMLADGKIRVIQCESLFVSEYEGQGWFHEVLKLLTDAGYVPVSFGEPKRNERHEIQWTDVIFKRRG